METVLRPTRKSLGRKRIAEIWTRDAWRLGCSPFGDAAQAHCEFPSLANRPESDSDRSSARGRPHEHPTAHAHAAAAAQLQHARARALLLLSKLPARASNKTPDSETTPVNSGERSWGYSAGGVRRARGAPLGAQQATQEGGTARRAHGAPLIQSAAKFARPAKGQKENNHSTGSQGRPQAHSQLGEIRHSVTLWNRTRIFVRKPRT